MSCPNLYFGTGRFGNAPLPALYSNDAIVMSSYVIQQNALVGGQLVVQNHGTDDSPVTHFELYRSDPTTGFAAVAANIILETDAAVGGTAVGSMTDSQLPMNWTYEFPNAGHFCLLARLSMNGPPGGACVQQAYDSSNPATDPHSAIHNIQVVAPPPAPAPGGGGGGAGPGFMGFAFAAMNMRRDVEKTVLQVRPLDPAKDREKLEQLVANPGVDRALSRRNVKFALPKAVLFGEGRERLQYRPEHFKKGHCAPRLRTVGEVNAATIKRLLLPGEKLLQAGGKHPLELMFGEARQTLIEVEPCGKDNVAYAVEVSHQTEDGRDIGGLVCIFVPPHKYF